MTTPKQLWPDLVSNALFEKDPTIQQQRISEAKTAIRDRLLELDTEKKMLLDARLKLNALTH